MIYINNLSINNEKTQLSVDVETNVGSNITRILLWNESTFKDYSQAIDISFKLEQINNKEVFILDSSEININLFEGIYFLEFTSDYENENDCIECQNTVIGVAANLNNINKYLLDLILSLEKCNNCPNEDSSDDIMNIHLTSKGITLALTLGYYEEAMFLYKKLKKLIGPKLDCRSCRNLRTPTATNGLNFATFNNTLILI